MIIQLFQQPMAQRQRIALYVALAFHISGFIAIGLLESQLFINLTPLNLLVCLALILYTQPRLQWGFVVFAICALVIGFGTEHIGINTGALFGQYAYGEVLGPKWQGVPYMIGVQWLVTMYCIGVAMQMLLHRFLQNGLSSFHRYPRWMQGLSLVIDGALLAVIFDWAIEPVAMHLHYWYWQNDVIPMFNYLTWYGVSAVILCIFHLLPFHKHNLFAVHLLLIQFMFFLLLRTVFAFQ